MKVVILAGGYGTRLSEHTSVVPKPLVEIGGRPILWHIMKLYAHHGLNEFVICCGYKGHVIKDYFLNYLPHQGDFTVDLQRNQIETPSQHVGAVEGDARRHRRENHDRWPSETRQGLSRRLHILHDLWRRCQRCECAGARPIPPPTRRSRHA